MRTTLVLDDDLVKKAKRRAAALDTSLSDIVNQALREALSKPKAEPARFEMPTFGDPKRKVHHEPRDLSTALEDEERATLRR